VTGRLHSTESFGAVDGPGVRFVIFLHGCDFRCAYCHNPDTWARAPAQELTAEEVLAKALRYRSYWGKDGGITLSGGEPMLQAPFAADLFERAKAQGVSTCLDTAAGPFRRDDPAIRRLLNATDTVLLDLKAFDPARHRQVTGADNAATLACARYLSEIGKPIWIRRVLVPGLTDDADDLRRTGAFIRTLATVEKIEVLPYHTLGVAKWAALGLDYPLPSAVPPSAEAVAAALKLLRQGDA
jgi:pyruvate formate lyase activating enzyme